MTTVRCAFCGWVGVEPSPAEFQSDEGFKAALAAFEADREAHCCPEYRASLPKPASKEELRKLEKELFG
jgi:rubredoxin